MMSKEIRKYVGGKPVDTQAYKPSNIGYHPWQPSIPKTKASGDIIDLLMMATDPKHAASKYYDSTNWYGGMEPWLQQKYSDPYEMLMQSLLRQKLLGFMPSGMYGMDR
jgi:hypothetical protein